LGHHHFKFSLLFTCVNTYSQMDSSLWVLAAIFSIDKIKQSKSLMLYSKKDLTHWTISAHITSNKSSYVLCKISAPSDPAGMAMPESIRSQTSSNSSRKKEMDNRRQQLPRWANKYKLSTHFQNSHFTHFLN
jgi:hypothetical protein